MSRAARAVVRHSVLSALLAVAMLGTAAGTTMAAGVAPLGYSMMCLKNPNECRPGGTPAAKSTEKLVATLKRVNSSVNRAIKPRNDRGADIWTVGATTGDCEDYVVAKRRALIKAGVPAGSLRIAYVKTKAGIDHAILIVRTEKQELVLDNLTPTIKPLSQTGYRVISKSGANPLSWS